jgi:hypothetical protein
VKTERPPCIYGDLCRVPIAGDACHLDWVSEHGRPDRMICTLYGVGLRPFNKPRRCGKCKRDWPTEEPPR